METTPTATLLRSIATVDRHVANAIVHRHRSDLRRRRVVDYVSGSSSIPNTALVRRSFLDNRGNPRLTQWKRNNRICRRCRKLLCLYPHPISVDTRSGPCVRDLQHLLARALIYEIRFVVRSTVAAVVAVVQTGSVRSPVPAVVAVVPEVRICTCARSTVERAAP